MKCVRSHAVDWAGGGLISHDVGGFGVAINSKVKFQMTASVSPPDDGERAMSSSCQ